MIKSILLGLLIFCGNFTPPNNPNALPVQKLKKKGLRLENLFFNAVYGDDFLTLHQDQKERDVFFGLFTVFRKEFPEKSQRVKAQQAKENFRILINKIETIQTKCTNNTIINNLNGDQKEKSKDYRIRSYKLAKEELESYLKCLQKAKNKCAGLKPHLAINIAQRLAKDALKLPKGFEKRSLTQEQVMNLKLKNYFYPALYKSDQRSKTQQESVWRNRQSENQQEVKKWQKKITLAEKTLNSLRVINGISSDYQKEHDNEVLGYHQRLKELLAEKKKIDKQLKSAKSKPATTIKPYQLIQLYSDILTKEMLREENQFKRQKMSSAQTASFVTRMRKASNKFSNFDRLHHALGNPKDQTDQTRKYFFSTWSKNKTCKDFMNTFPNLFTDSPFKQLKKDFCLKLHSLTSCLVSRRRIDQSFINDQNRNVTPPPPPGNRHQKTKKVKSFR